MFAKIKFEILDYIKYMFSLDMFAKRTTMSLVSAFVIPFGISTLLLSGFGVDPFTSLMVNTSETFGIAYPVLQLIVYSAILFFVIIFAKRGLVGLGTILNAVITGFVFDFFNNLYTLIPETLTQLLAFKIACLLVGLVILSFGCSLFFTAGIGVGAYDTIGFLMVRKFKLQYKWARIITDLTSVVLGLVIAGTLTQIFAGNFASFPNVGIGTIITGFFMGPLIAEFNDKVSIKLLEHDYSCKTSKLPWHDCQANS